MHRRFALILLLAAAFPARAEPIALTFDDLPVFGHPLTVPQATAITERLLRGLRRHHLPAIGFVNEINLEGADKAGRVALLKRWLDAGMDLGNHGYSHLSLTTTPVDDYIADTAKGDAVTKSLEAAVGKTPRWFRHPYLETGPTLAIRHTFEDWLARDGYRVAPVTMENADYAFAMPYDDALDRGDRKRARAVRRAYIAYSKAIVPWYRAAGLSLLGRHPAFVLLLHASRLNADSIGALAAILRHEKLHGVTLDAAMTDPAYAMVDDYAGPDGNEWLERWSVTMGKDLPWESMPKMPPGIKTASAALDADAEDKVP